MEKKYFWYLIGFILILQIPLFFFGALNRRRKEHRSGSGKTGNA